MNELPKCKLPLREVNRVLDACDEIERTTTNYKILTCISNIREALRDMDIGKGGN